MRVTINQGSVPTETATIIMLVARFRAEMINGGDGWYDRWNAAYKMYQRAIALTKLTIPQRRAAYNAGSIIPWR